MNADGRNRRASLRWLLLFLAAALVAALAADRVFFAAKPALFQDRREMMDTWVTVTVYDTSEDHARESMELAFTRMKNVVDIASVQDPNAEAARLNSEGRSASPSPELLEIVAAAKHYYEISGGVFDIAIEPLLALWRHAPEAGSQLWELPQEEQEARIAAVMGRIGADRIILGEGPSPYIELPPGMRITLGGIAKGYVVDQGLAVLRENGIRHALIDAGGDIGAMGGKPGGAKWEIALRNPTDAAGLLARFVVADGAIATSGNYARYFDPAATVGHIIDPRTGFSAHAASSATVIAPTCVEADALATAIFVLGPSDGVRLADSLDGVEAMVLDYENPTMIRRSQHLGDYEVPEKDGS